jgi:hypothetical protein
MRQRRHQRSAVNAIGKIRDRTSVKKITACRMQQAVPVSRSKKERTLPLASDVAAMAVNVGHNTH